MSDFSRSDRLHAVIGHLLAQVPEIEAAAVVSFDGLPMASALPASMDEDRVAAMSAALLSLGERAAEGLGRGALDQVYIEGEHGTVFLVSAADEAVLVAVAARGAKAGMMLYEVRRAAADVGDVLRRPEAEPVTVADALAAAASVDEPVRTYDEPSRTYDEPARAYEPPAEPLYTPPDPDPLSALTAPAAAATPAAPTASPASPTAQQSTAPEPADDPLTAPYSADNSWPTYLPNGASAEPSAWS